MAESFGDLDPKMDLREADVEPGDEWTGWHLLEKDLWPADAERLHAADPRRARDVRRRPARQHHRPRRRASRTSTYTVDQIANGSRGLLEEVATGKVTGEEEYWSHTDLWDFQANVDGARVGFEGVEPIVEKNDPELADRARRPASTSCRRCSTRQRAGDGFKLYTDLTAGRDQGPRPTRSTRCPSRSSRLTAAVV